jgi:hypothetical protein
VNFHETIVHRASVILLWMAIIEFIAGFAEAIAARTGSSDPYSGESGFSALQFLTPLHTGISSAVLPFIGSAVVWLMQNGKGGAK